MVLLTLFRIVVWIGWDPSPSFGRLRMTALLLGLITRTGFL
jgi:hypothetical protein